HAYHLRLSGVADAGSLASGTAAMQWAKPHRRSTIQPAAGYAQAVPTGASLRRWARRGIKPSALRVLAILGLLLDLLADLLHVLAGAGHGVAGGQRRGGEHRQQQQCEQTFHRGSSCGERVAVPGNAAPANACHQTATAREAGVQPAALPATAGEPAPRAAFSRASGWTCRTGSRPGPPPAARWRCACPARG